MKGILRLAPIAASIHPLALQAQATVTGYVTTSYTASSEHLADTIVGRAYDRRHNEFMLNVGNVTIDKPVVTDKRSAGIHFEAWFGENAEPVKSVGLNLGPDADIWQAYATLNLPLSGQGRYMQLKGGKLATLMGVEVGEDILNPNLGVGYQDIFLEPYTETGVEWDGKFSATYDLELRVSNGWDQVTDINSGKTVMARLGLTPNDKTLLALLGYTGPEQSKNDGNLRSGAQALLSRKLTSAFTTQLQLDYGQEDGAAARGAQSKWYAAGLWATLDLKSATTLALRADYMDDRDGTRTSGVLGFPVTTGLKVASITGTATFKQFDHALVRPECRFDHSSLNVFAGNNSQVSCGLGLSYVF